MKKINFTGIKSESRLAFILNLVVSSNERNIIIVLPDTENINTFVNELNLYLNLIKAVNKIKVTAYNKFKANIPQTIKEALNLITQINDQKNNKICIVANSDSLEQKLPTKEDLLKKS